MLTYMQTVRFLTDYLDGDTYYKIKFPEHNLQRSYAQFKLLQSIEPTTRDVRLHRSLSNTAYPPANLP